MAKSRVAKIYFGVVGGGALFWLGNTVSHDARLGYEGGNALEAARAANEGLRNLHFGLSLNPIDLAVGAGLVLALGLVVVYQVVGRGNQRRGEEHGSARWGRASDIAPLTNKKPERNLLLTRTERISLDRIEKQQHQRNLNVACIGAAGSGKSRNFILPNLNQAQGSYLVTDPKGELLAECGERLTNEGFKIRVLNLVELGESFHFNPMAYLRPGHEPEDIGLLALNIIANTDPGKTRNADPFWPRAERALLTALIGFVAATYPPEESNLGSVVDLLGQMRASGDDESLSPADQIFQGGKDYLSANPGMENGDLLGFAIANYQIYQQAAEKTAASIIVTAATRLAPLHIPSVRRLVSTDTLELDDIGFEKTAVFLIISDVSRQYAWLSSMFFTVFFQRAVYLADREPTRRLPVPVMCWMDEFANIGRIPEFEVLAATLRSRGISYQLVIQNLGQGKVLYEDAWASILGNCDTVLFLGSADAATKDYVAKELGKETIMVNDTSRSKGRTGSHSESQRHQGRELLTSDEVGRIGGDEAIVLIRGLPPFRSKKLPAIKPQTQKRDRTHNRDHEYIRTLDRGDGSHGKPPALSQPSRRPGTLPMRTRLLNVDTKD